MRNIEGEGYHHNPIEARESYIERAVDNLDARLFIRHFFQPHDSDDSLDYMAAELVTPKSGEQLQIQAEMVQELLSDSSSLSSVEAFVTEDYQLKAHLSKRKQILNEYQREIDDLISDRSDIQKYNKRCYYALTAFHNLILITSQLDSSTTLLRRLKTLGECASKNETYQATAAMIESMTNFGYGNIGVHYNYFGSPVAPVRIKMERRERWLEVAKWYAHIANVSLQTIISAGVALLIHPLREELFTRFMHDAVEQNLSSMEQMLEWRKPLDFFLGGLRFTEAMQEHGLPLTSLQPTDDPEIVLRGLYNPCLLLQEHIRSKEDIVLNDVDIRPPRTVNILTGPNYCGKSVYIKALGLAVGLGKNGFPVPAQTATIGNIDCILTHFVQAENIALGESGFTNEIERIDEMFRQATPGSFIIINESVITSSHEDDDEIATWVIAALGELQCPVVMVTHAHSVAQLVDNWASVRNLQTEVRVTDKEIIPAYRIIPGRAGSSYGVKIAEQHGFTKDNWLKMAKIAKRK